MGSITIKRDGRVFFRKVHIGTCRARQASCDSKEYKFFPNADGPVLREYSRRALVKHLTNRYLERERMAAEEASYTKECGRDGEQG